MIKLLFLIVSVVICHGLIRDAQDIESHEYLSFEDRDSLNENWRTPPSIDGDSDSTNSEEVVEPEVPNFIQRNPTQIALALVLISMIVFLIVVGVRKNI